MKRYSLLIFSLAAAVSCKPFLPSETSSIKYVEDIIGNTASEEFILLENFDPASSSGTIAVIGDPMRCSSIGNAIIDLDEFDNVDGSDVVDRLPDFAGERIVLVPDEVNPSYSSFIQDSRLEELRELTVKMCINSLSMQENAKLIVLTSPEMDVYGLEDFRFLAEKVGTDVPVLSSFRVAVEAALKRDPSMIGVISSASADACSAVVKELSSGKVSCVTINENTMNFDNLLIDFLDKYSAMGYVEPIDVLIVDDSFVDRELLEIELFELKTSFSESTADFEQLISDELTIVDVDNEISKRCFEVMRERNIFTHNVSYPEASVYSDYVQN